MFFQRYFFVILFCYVLISPSFAWAKTVFDLQEGRQIYKEIYAHDQHLKKPNEIRVHVLNPSVPIWILVEFDFKGRKDSAYFHLENPFPMWQQLSYDANHPGGLMVEIKDQKKFCSLWGDSNIDLLVHAKNQKKPFVPLCEGRIYLRNPTEGHMSAKEKAVDFLRNHLWGGESLISFLKDSLFKDSEIILDEEDEETSSDLSDDLAENLAEKKSKSNQMPMAAQVQGEQKNVLLHGKNLGISRKNKSKSDAKNFKVGQWYPSDLQKGVYVSIFRPDVIPQSILASYTMNVSPLDKIESKAHVYLVAFDMSQLELGYTVGTDHPEVTYSERASRMQRIPGTEGPDGFGDVKPLVRTGMINPALSQHVVATWNGGFKRKHSVFRIGELAKKNQGSHYGFMQDGVILSSLQEGLASLIMYKDGSFRMKTWSKSDEENLENIRSVRQNGLPILYTNYSLEANQNETRPGEYVNQNFKGNWSGNKKNEVRALRTAICTQESEVNGRLQQWLIFGYFSSHTPNGIARTFQSYGCAYAMHLDMNLRVHTYLALYGNDESSPDGESLVTQHIMDDMFHNDMKIEGRLVPRFVGFPDNRDFFYLIRK